jgi:hypothetical protein
MKTSFYVKTIIVVAGCSLLGTGCVVRERGVYAGPPVADVSVSSEMDVSGPPPAPLEETVTVAPEPGFVWIGGVWVWGGGGWRWERGHWGRPPHPGAVWVPHRYVYRGGRHVWVRGGWR